MRNRFFLFIFTFVICYSNDCPLEYNNIRSIYSVGDTLSIEDQNLIYPVCNGSQSYQDGDLFSFSDLNGNLNGGDYKISIISMNATW